jgi:hypothetical protein
MARPLVLNPREFSALLGSEAGNRVTWSMALLATQISPVDDLVKWRQNDLHGSASAFANDAALREIALGKK